MQGPWKSMTTLTYHKSFPSDYRESKKHLNKMTKWLTKRNLLYLWIVEWQSRGFPHFHFWLDREFNDVPLWDDDNGKNSWRPIMRKWLKVTGQENDEAAVSFGLHQKNYTGWKVDIKVNYAGKYASKNEQKGLPNGIKSFGRWWGHSRELVLEEEVLMIPDSEESFEDRLESFAEWNQFRRQVKRFIERKFKFRFSRDRVGSCLPLRWTMKEEFVECVERFSVYYLRNFRVMSSDGERIMF